MCARCPTAASRLTFKYGERSESPTSRRLREFVTGWLKEIGIATEVSVYNDSQLTHVIGKGDFDLFVWGWTPFVDPDPMLSYFTCDQVATDPDDPTNYYNDANWCNEEYDKLYAAAERRARRGQAHDIVHDMLTRLKLTGRRTSCSTTPTCRRTAPTGSRAG